MQALIVPVGSSPLPRQLPVPVRPADVAPPVAHTLPDVTIAARPMVTPQLLQPLAKKAPARTRLRQPRRIVMAAYASHAAMTGTNRAPVIDVYA